MDHVIRDIEAHYEVVLDCFIDEQRNNNYKRLSENSYFDEVHALIESMNILRKYMGWEPLKLSEEIERED